MGCRESWAVPRAEIIIVCLYINIYGNDSHLRFFSISLLYMEVKPACREYFVGLFWCSTCTKILFCTSVSQLNSYIVEKTLLHIRMPSLYFYTQNSLKI